MKIWNDLWKYEKKNFSKSIYCFHILSACHYVWYEKMRWIVEIFFSCSFREQKTSAWVKIFITSIHDALMIEFITTNSKFLRRWMLLYGKEKKSTKSVGITISTKLKKSKGDEIFINDIISSHRRHHYNNFTHHYDDCYHFA